MFNVHALCAVAGTGIGMNTPATRLGFQRQTYYSPQKNMLSSVHHIVLGKWTTSFVFAPYSSQHFYVELKVSIILDLIENLTVVEEWISVSLKAPNYNS
jgi:hypothetical protein